MSGGHWDYCQFRVRDHLNDVANDGEIIRRFPKVAQVLRGFAYLLEDTIHKLDYDISGDSEIEDDEKFEKQFIKELGVIIEKKYKLKVYETYMVEGD